MKCIYYQCTNTGCNFRFPTNDIRTSDLRCPSCKSTVKPSLTIELHGENPDPITSNDLKIEVLLDNIRSAWNVGSIIRTAESFGIRRLHFCGITPTPNNKRVIKTSLGSEKFIDWTQNNNSVKKIQELKRRSFPIFVLEGHPRAKNIYCVDQVTLKNPFILVAGNEICGVDPEILALSDQILQIPMVGSKQSLNVAVAFGIAISALKYFQL